MLTMGQALFQETENELCISLHPWSAILGTGIHLNVRGIRMSGANPYEEHEGAGGIEGMRVKVRLTLPTESHGAWTGGRAMGLPSLGPCLKLGSECFPGDSQTLIHVLQGSPSFPDLWTFRNRLNATPRHPPNSHLIDAVLVFPSL